MADASRQFHFELSEDSEELRVLVARTKFDVTCASAFRSEVDRHWSPAIQRVILDFHRVEFIDSSGVGALVGLQKRLNPTLHPITLLNPGPAVVTVVELLRLHRVFRLTHSIPPEMRPESRLPPRAP